MLDTNIPKYTHQSMNKRMGKKLSHISMWTTTQQLQIRTTDTCMNINQCGK